MDKFLPRSFARIAILSAAALIAFASVALASTFQEPNGPPPTNDVPAPINVGSTAQYRPGSLGIGTDGNAVHPLDVYGNTNGYSIVAGSNIGSLGDICTLKADGTKNICLSSAGSGTNYFTLSGDGSTLFNNKAVAVKVLGPNPAQNYISFVPQATIPGTGFPTLSIDQINLGTYGGTLGSSPSAANITYNDNLGFNFNLSSEYGGANIAQFGVNQSTHVPFVNFSSETVTAGDFCITGSSTCLSNVSSGPGPGTNYWTLLSNSLYPNSTANLVGIGTTNPGTTLDTSGGLIRVQGGSAFGVKPASGTGLELGYNTSGSGSGYIDAYDRGASAFKQLELESAPLTINAVSGGVVGIGKAPSGTYQLDVNGSAGAADFCINSGSKAGTCLSSAGGGGGGGGLTGSGSTNYVVKFTGSTAVGNSSIFDNGNVGIGTASPDQKLEVNGAAHIGNDLILTRTDGFGTASIVVDPTVTPNVAIQKTGGGNITSIMLAANTVTANGVLAANGDLYDQGIDIIRYADSPKTAYFFPFGTGTTDNTIWIGVGSSAATNLTDVGTVSAYKFCILGGSCTTNFSNTGGVTGSGNVGYLSVWTGSSNPSTSLGNSFLTVSGGNTLSIGGGTTLDSSGNIIAAGTVSAGNEVVVQGSLNINGNQVWNSAGDLYLNFSAPNSTVHVGGSGSHNLSVDNGNANANDFCLNDGTLCLSQIRDAYSGSILIRHVCGGTNTAYEAYIDVTRGLITGTHTDTVADGSCQ